MRAFITGQVGVEKGPFLEAVKTQAIADGLDLEVCHVGRMMYQEAPDVPAGRILNLPITRLNALRRGVFKEILRQAERHDHLIVNSHATFRWRHGLFSAFDVDQLRELDADFYVTILDNAESVHQRLLRDHDLDHTLKDVMVWREEELLATELIANITRGHGHFFMMGRGRQSAATSTLYRLLFESRRKRVYLSFPMSHVMDQPEILAWIDDFKLRIAQHFIAFDPAEVDEFFLHTAAVAALREGRSTIVAPAAGGPITLKTADVAAISGDVLGQIIARDFKMIDQSDMIVSLIPPMPDGKPAVSSGVERELHHAYEAGKEVYVIWTCQPTPSPFITETATRVFGTIDEALEHFQMKGYIPSSTIKIPPGELFA